MLGSRSRWEVLQYTSWCPNGHFSLRPAPWNLDQAWSLQARLNNKLILSWCTATSALPYLDFAWPYEEVWEHLLFILHFIECQNSATVIAKQSSLAEKGWLRRNFCLLNSLDSDSRCWYFKLGADIAFLVLHQTQSPSQTLQYAKYFFCKVSTYSRYEQYYISQ